MRRLIGYMEPIIAQCMDLNTEAFFSISTGSIINYIKKLEADMDEGQ